jgi:NitT/TauT family transport system substrate-binding protein
MQRILRSSLLAAAAMIGATLAHAEDIPVIHLGWGGVPSGAAPLAVLARPGIAVNEGKTYRLQFTHFNSSPPMITAQATGDIDLAGLAYSSFALAVENAKMKDLRVIADVFQDGVEGYFSTRYMVLNDSGIKTVADLKGRIVTTNAGGSAVDMALRQMLKNSGPQEKRDYSLVESAFRNMKSELANHKVDLISATLPFAADTQLQAMAHPLFTQKEAIGRSQMIVMAARAPFIAAHRAALIDYLADSLRELRWYADPAHHDEVVKVVSDFTKIPPELWSRYIFSKGDVFHDPQGLPDLEALQHNIVTQHELGFLPASLDVGSYTDLSLVRAAAKQLSP